MEKRNYKIYAVDFDGTLCENAWPEIGKPMINLPMQSTGARNMASNSTRSTKMFQKFSKHLGLKPEGYTRTYIYR